VLNVRRRLNSTVAATVPIDRIRNHRPTRARPSLSAIGENASRALTGGDTAAPRHNFGTERQP
jgi:hypothetical protein